MNDHEIIEINSLEDNVLEELSDLLIDIVEDGASIGFLPPFRKKGIAKALMVTLENRAKMEGRSLLILDTRAGDLSNILYRSLGYMEAGRIPNIAQSADGSLDATIFYYKLI
ncbi:Acetyltransferase (GNAT) family protein [Paenibacillus sp. yr247]|uniref:GNAT family N-acetyltransferase n=1 Tax=Paenibacillus sp. yr247 TaxID=1761880 RepID=UPI000884D3B8|nr:GNAT family N-acetyltransferase [Paenibacillus sp. yr247]SDN02917.1 Acetyltransferase (GNAT) family protein [Paenibacillus sp. yr247]